MYISSSLLHLLFKKFSLNCEFFQGNVRVSVVAVSSVLTTEHYSPYKEKNRNLQLKNNALSWKIWKPRKMSCSPSKPVKVYREQKLNSKEKIWEKKSTDRRSDSQFKCKAFRILLLPTYLNSTFKLLSLKVVQHLLKTIKKQALPYFF